VTETLAKPLWGVCKREVRIQNSGVRIIVHVAREKVPFLNTEFWLLNTALAEPTKEVLQAPLLPFDRGGGLGADVEDDPVDASHLIDDTV
jgi:hypothetical protein